MQGIVKFFDEKRFYGFIANEGGEWFFHASTVKEPVAKGDEVEFSLDDDGRHIGKLKAIDVHKCSGMQ
jgi:cold shock CspA family protein